MTTRRPGKLPTAMPAPRLKAAEAPLKAPNAEPLAPASAWKAREASPLKALQGSLKRDIKQVGDDLKKAGVGSATFELIKREATQKADIALGMLAVQTARDRLETQLKDGTLTGAQIDAEHAAVAAKPMPQSLDEAIGVTLDRLRVTGAERSLILKGFEHIKAGQSSLGIGSESIGGGEATNRDTHRTQMAVTDYGMDHLLMSVTDPRMMNGAWLHVERIDRTDKEGKPTADAYPYGLPPPTLLSSIRYFAGPDVPVTLFYGHPNYRPSAKGEVDAPKRDWTQEAQGYFNNFDKATGDLSYVLRDAIRSGASELKMSADGLNRKQLVDLVTTVTNGTPNAMGVTLAPGQYLSLAFNLQKATKDLGIGEPIAGIPNAEQRKQLAAVAREAVDIAAEANQGHGGKVTLDSASMTPPSFPLVEYFGSRNMFEWAHYAHKKGLETYASAGMEPYHYPLLAMTMVDGIGTGTSIHDKTPYQGVLGRLSPSKVHEGLRLRDQTEQSAPGQAARLLRQIAEKSTKGPLSTLDLRLESELLTLIGGQHEKIDVALDTLKANRATALADLEKRKTELGDKYAAEVSKVGATFRTEFEALISSVFSEPDFVAKAQGLVKNGQQLGGYQPMENPS